MKAYQLQPLRMALGMRRVNLFIADDVGLGAPHFRAAVDCKRTTSRRSSSTRL